MQVFSKNVNFDSNLDGIREYTLGDPRVICRILSDNLYSNKIGSIIRELSANALDAHRMCGIEDRPFDVTLPGQDGLFIAGQTPFSIRDYGPGLSESEIYSLYTSYGSSSKRDDAGQIGGFGIGSKSPFAYTDAFTVTSWNDGFKSSYICFLNKEGSPCIKKIFEMKSQEPTGMQVDIPIKLENDAERFRDECANQYAFYDVQPNGGLGIKPTIIYENKYGTIYQSSTCPRHGKGLWTSWRSNDVLYGKVNNFIYKMTWDDAASSSPKYGMRNGHIGYNTLPFNDGVCILNIDASLVDLSASREELAFTERTKQTIETAWESFVCKIWKDICRDMEERGKTSRFEAVWYWKVKGINFTSFREWIQKGGKGVDWMTKLNNKVDCAGCLYPLFVVDASKIIERMIDGSLRGYEGVGSKTYRGNPVVTKMLRTSAGTLSTKEMKTVMDGTNKEGYPYWMLNVSERFNFKLIFVNKDATFTAIKEQAKSILQDLPHGFIHIYATNDEAVRKSIIEAYGNPSGDHIVEVVLKAPKKASISEIKEKRERVKARCNFGGIGNGYHYSLGSADLVLQKIRSRLKEEWLSREEIESHIENGAVIIVTNGIEASMEYNPSQLGILTVAGCICNYKSRIPLDWILLNEQSYAKLLSLGFAPLNAEYSRKKVKEMLASIGVDFDDFIKWIVMNTDETFINFDRLEDVYRFSTRIASDHSEHPAAKAILCWKQMKHTLECNMNGIGRLSDMMFNSKYGLYSKNERIQLEEKAKQDLQWSKIREWYEANPILNLVCHCYGNDKEQEVNANILAKYLVWD